MSDAVDLARLPKMSLKELRGLWAMHFNGEPPSPRSFLIREIAWRVQQEREGGFDSHTRRLLQAAMRTALSVDDVEIDGKHSTDESALARTHRAPINRSTKLPAAACLVREWGGERHEVTVVEHGKAYRYKDKTYKSLTEIAREITGTRWSGPRFFGLTRRTKPEAADTDNRNGKAR